MIIQKLMVWEKDKEVGHLINHTRGRMSVVHVLHVLNKYGYLQGDGGDNRGICITKNTSKVITVLSMIKRNFFLFSSSISSNMIQLQVQGTVKAVRTEAYLHPQVENEVEEQAQYFKCPETETCTQ